MQIKNYKWLLFVVVLLLSMNLTSATIDYENDMFLWIPLWQVNESINPLHDLSHTGNNHSATNNGATFRSDKTGYRFDGSNDYMTIADDSELDLTASYSISLWYNVTVAKVSEVNNWIGKATPSTSGWMLYYTHSGALTPPHAMEYFGYTYATRPVTTNTGLITNQWNNIVVTYDNSTHKNCVYMNGYPNCVTQTGSIVANSNPVYLMKYATNYLDGDLANVMIFDKALTGTEINESIIANGENYNPFETSINNFTVTAKDSYDDSSISNFSVKIGGILVNQFGGGSKYYQNWSMSSIYDDLFINNYVVNVSCDVSDGLLKLRLDESDFIFYDVFCFNGVSFVDTNITVVGLTNVYPFYSLNTTSGTITTHILDNDTSTYNITFFDAVNGKGAFFNRAYYDVDVSSNLQGSLSQAFVTFEAFTKITNTSLNGDFLVNGSTFVNGQNISAGTYNITYYNNSNDFYNHSNTIVIPALFNSTKSVTGLYDNVLNVTLNNYTFNGSGGESVSNFTGIISSSLYGFEEVFNTTPNNYYLANLEQGVNFTVYTTQDIYVNNTASNTQYITPNSTTNILNFILKRANSLIISARNVLTNAYINNVNISLYGVEDYFYQFNKTVMIFPLNASFYNIIASAATYSPITTTTTVIDRGTGTLDLYFTGESDNLIIAVRNQFEQYIQGATVKIIREYDGQLISSTTTDYTGQTELYLDQSLNYIVSISADGYQNLSATLKPNSQDAIYIFTLEQLDQEEVNKYEGITYSWSPNVNILQNNTDYNISFSFSPGNIWSVTGCGLTIKDDDNNVINSTFNSSCNAADTITLLINTDNYTSITANGIIEINGTNITYKKFYDTSYYYEGDASLIVALRNLKAFDKGGFGRFGLTVFVLLIILLILTMAKDSEGSSFLRPQDTLFLLTGLVIVASILDLLTLTIPTASDFVNQWLIAMLVGFFTIASYVVLGGER